MSDDLGRQIDGRTYGPTAMTIADLILELKVGCLYVYEPYTFWKKYRKTDLVFVWFALLWINVTFSNISDK